MTKKIGLQAPYRLVNTAHIATCRRGQEWRALTVICLFAALTPSAGCDAFVDLKGRVVDVDGNLIGGAHVRVEPSNLEPNQPAGTFVAHSAGGSIRVSIAAAGYRPVKKTVRGGMTKYDCTFVLAPTSGPSESRADCRRN
jgi:hypothetical protein